MRFLNSRGGGGFEIFGSHFRGWLVKFEGGGGGSRWSLQIRGGVGFEVFRLLLSWVWLVKFEGGGGSR